MGEYLSFKKQFTPYLVQIVFWLGVAFNTFDALIEVFQINATLTEIRDEQRKQAVAAMFVPTPVPATTPPAV
jgi:hypothetical protein